MMEESQKKAFWVPCPVCNRKTKTKIYEDTVLMNFPLYCPSCKREFALNVIKLKMVIAKEPDA